MDFYSPFALALCLGGIGGIASTWLFRAADTPPSPQANRIVSMDGMRGFLALAVVFHHVAIYHRFLLDGVWGLPESGLFRFLGPVAVALFFMITAFLFWGQLLRANGRPSWVALYTGRIFRIGPLYLAAVAVVLATVAVETGFRLHESPGALAQEVLPWLSLGLLKLPDINGYPHTKLLLAEVTWTLAWEWIFYLSLPVLALCARRKGWHLRFVLGAILACQAYLHLAHGGPHKDLVAYAMLFLLGMLTASLRHEGWQARLPDVWSSMLVVLLLVTIFFFGNPTVNTLSQVMIGAILYLVISGCSLFGLLRTRAAIRLGDISYGIYLLQGLALALVFRQPWSRAHDLVSPVDHWLLALGSAVLLVCVATATHVWIERPGIAAGEKIAQRLRRRRGVRALPLVNTTIRADQREDQAKLP
jgi:peptidoglycan/LPS O-acetylase OafA/YrhL